MTGLIRWKELSFHVIPVNVGRADPEASPSVVNHLLQSMLAGSAQSAYGSKRLDGFRRLSR